MTAYTLFHEDTEIIGQVILDFAEAIGSDRFHGSFEKHGLVDVDPAIWYPAQKWLDVLNDVAENNSAMFDFVSIGIKQIELAIMPPEFDDMSIEEIFISLEEAYQLNYRGSDIGSLHTEVLNEGHLCLTVRSFEPDDLWYGNAHGIMRRYAPPGTDYVVYYDPDLPRSDQESERTVLHIEWR